MSELKRNGTGQINASWLPEFEMPHVAFQARHSFELL